MLRQILVCYESILTGESRAGVLRKPTNTLHHALFFLFRFGRTRREKQSPWCDQPATHPSQKAAKDGAPTARSGIGRLGQPSV
jgi:hypothetical protein